MSNPITAADASADAKHQLNFEPTTINGGIQAVSLHGDTNDFVWAIQQSHDNGENYIAMKDVNGDSSYTGCVPVEWRALKGVRYQVEVTSLGTATSIEVRNN